MQLVVLVSALLAACNSERDGRAPGMQTPVTIGPASPGAFVGACAPCIVRVGDDTGDFTLTFDVRQLAGGQRGISEIHLAPRGRAGVRQTFAVRDSAALGASDLFFVGAFDLNFDGYSDFFLATSQGVANTYADHWLFEPGAGRFKYLGNYPLFTIDSAQRRLKTYERGGDAGLIYTANQYEFSADTIVLVESEIQEATAQAGVYRRRVLRRQAGELRVIRTETVRAPPG
jgi:hypothetical protein